MGEARRIREARIGEKEAEEIVNKKKKKNQDANEEEEEYTKSVQIIENKVNDQQQIANDQMADLQSKMSALSTSSNSLDSPSKSILKNPQNPNFEQDQQKLRASLENSDDEDNDGLDSIYMRKGGNMNKARGPPPRKLTKQRKRGKKNSRGKNRRKGGRGDREEEEDENKENDEEEEEEEKAVRFYEQN